MYEVGGGGREGIENDGTYLDIARGEDSILGGLIPGRKGRYPGGSPRPKLLLNAASLDLDADVLRLRSFPVVPPMKTSSLVGSIIQ